MAEWEAHFAWNSIRILGRQNAVGRQGEKDLGSEGRGSDSIRVKESLTWNREKRLWLEFSIIHCTPTRRGTLFFLIIIGTFH